MSTKRRIDKCPVCKKDIEDRGYAATLLDSQPKKFCSKICYERLSKYRLKRSWLGRENELSKKYPDVFFKLFGNMSPLEASLQNSQNSQTSQTSQTSTTQTKPIQKENTTQVQKSENTEDVYEVYYDSQKV